MADDTPAASAASLTSADAGALTGKPAEPGEAAKSANADLYKVDELKPATEMAASGALIEPTIVERVPLDHPAIDSNPRAGQSVAANRIDMNDPSIPGHVASARRLGMTEGEPETAPKA